MSGPEGLISDRALAELERAHPRGFTSAQIVEIFQARGLRFSEATLRKYVQLGLLPRSRREGRPGKHTGSVGVYPPETVRRVNAIKRMMAESYTIEEIQGSFLRFKDQIDALKRGFSELFAGFERQLKVSAHDAGRRRTLARELEDARGAADALVGRVQGLERQIVLPLERAARARAFSAGAAKGAGDLL